MTKFGITYIGHLKDEFGCLVKFNIKGTLYTYKIDAIWLENIENAARHSEPKALNMVKTCGELVEKEKIIRKKEVTNVRTTQDNSDSGGEVEGRPEVASGPETLRSVDDNGARPDVAQPEPHPAILRAREIMRKSRDEGHDGGA